jgi:hypothetical protein
MFAGTNQTFIIKVGGSVTVTGHDDERVVAESQGGWGLTLERRSAAEIGRARAAVGERVLFDWRIKVPSPLRSSTKGEPDEVIEIQMSGSGEVRVPFQSNLKIYAGKAIEVQGINGSVDAYAGSALSLHAVRSLGNASAGGAMTIDCETMLGQDVTFSAGGDLTFHVKDLSSARLRVRDLGGYWEARIGAAERSVYLKSGGDVTIVTDQRVEPLPPYYMLGNIVKPSGVQASGRN